MFSLIPVTLQLLSVISESVDESSVMLQASLTPIPTPTTVGHEQLHKPVQFQGTVGITITSSPPSIHHNGMVRLKVPKNNQLPLGSYPVQPIDNPLSTDCFMADVTKGGLHEAALHANSSATGPTFTEWMKQRPELAFYLEALNRDPDTSLALDTMTG